MNKFMLITFLVASVQLGRGAIWEFDLSPPGAGTGVGLSPLNEVIPTVSNGSGNEVGSGIKFDTESLKLTLDIGYGSAEGFDNLSGSAFAWFLHGPANSSETASVLFDLAPHHTFASDHALGGRITASLEFTPNQATDLLGGRQYINIYTSLNPGGEIRGQLTVVPEPSTAALLLAGIASVGAVSIARRLSNRGRSDFAPFDRNNRK